MFWVTQYLRGTLATFITAIICLMPLSTYAAPAPLTAAEEPKIIITEVQTNGGLAAQEFIELYNTTDQAVELNSAVGSGSSQYKLRFYGSSVFNSGVPSWATTPYVYDLRGVIQPSSHFIVSSHGYSPAGTAVPAEQQYTKSNVMTDSGGGLELVEVTGVSGSSITTLHDRLSWLDPVKNPTGGVLPAPVKGGSLQRQPNVVMSENGNIYIGEPAQIFISDPDITPMSVWQAPVSSLSGAPGLGSSSVT